MALRIPYGLDPDETWEVDFVEASAQRAIERFTRTAEELEEAAKTERDPEKKAAILNGVKAAKEGRTKLAADLVKYERGTGPIFVLGPLPNAKRAEFLGESYEVGKIQADKEREVRDTAWSEDVVRWSVRGHRNFFDGKARDEDGNQKELVFVAEEVPFCGEKRKVVGRRTLEAYGRFIGELALVVLRSQRLDEAGKNA